jgi:Spy/CpxP family protein refolding chaperone
MRSLVVSLTLAVMLVGAGLYVAVEAQDQNRQGVGEGLAERIQDLNLTEAQEAKIVDIRKEYRPKVEAAAKQLAAAAKEEVEKAQAVLTPEQKTKLRALREERKERRAEGLAERLAHLDQLDLTDAEVAKIQAIRKEYRPKIEAAMKNMQGLLSPEQRKARAEGLRAGKKRRAILASLNLTDNQKEKVEAVCKEVGTLVREELEKIRDVLTEEQQAKLPELKDERRDRIRDRMAARIVNFKDLDLTAEQKSKLQDIRQEYRPKVHEVGNKFRAAVRAEVEAIVAVMKG